MARRRNAGCRAGAFARSVRKHLKRGYALTGLESQTALHGTLRSCANRESDIRGTVVFLVSQGPPTSRSGGPAGGRRTRIADPRSAEWSAERGC